MYMHPLTHAVGQPVGHPMVQPTALVGATYPVGTIPMMPQQLVYAPQPMMVQQQMPQVVPATVPIYQVAAPPPRQQKNKGNAVLFVGQLNYDVTEKDVRDLFSYYGNVVNVVLLKDNKRNAKPSSPQPKSHKHVVGSSAFVTYPTTAEADLAIMSLHNRYCMDNRDKPVQVSYCQKTDIISDFGYRHALQLHSENPANPIPSITPTPSIAYAIKFA